MKDIEKKQQRQAEFMRMHTLDSNQRQRLIDEKLARAYNHYKAVQKREDFCKEG
jgi:hypothetical protein